MQEGIPGSSQKGLDLIDESRDEKFQRSTLQPPNDLLTDCIGGGAVTTTDHRFTMITSAAALNKGGKSVVYRPLSNSINQGSKLNNYQDPAAPDDKDNCNVVPLNDLGSNGSKDKYQKEKETRMKSMRRSHTAGVSSKKKKRSKSGADKSKHGSNSTLAFKETISRVDKSEKKKQELFEKEKEKLQKLQTSLLTTAKMKEEEQKYEKNEDFTAFLRKRATTRKIANIFTDLRQKIVDKRENSSRQ